MDKIKESSGNIGKPMLAGACLCGAIHYAVADEFLYALNCHCSDCRKATGSAFKPFAGIGRSKLQIIKGADQILVFGDPNLNHDVRCKLCGSFLYSVVGTDRIHVTLGALVDRPTVVPTAHIFVADKAPWFQICDTLPQYPGHMP
jgi:hypothetical protein